MKLFVWWLPTTLVAAGCSIEIPEEPRPSNPSIEFEPTTIASPEVSAETIQEQFASVDEALAVLVNASSADDKKQEMAAYVWLSKQGASAIEPVAATMNDRSLPIAARRHACRVLGHLGPSAAEPLIAASRSEEAALKLRAIETLPAVEPAPQAVVDRLIVLLDDPNDQVKHTAIRSLGHIGPSARAAADKLNALRDNVNNSETTRHEAGKSLKLVRPIRSFED